MSTAHGQAPTQSNRAEPRRQPGRPKQAPLRVVAPRPAEARRNPFVALLVVLLGAGLVGLLLLNTAMQRRAFVLTGLGQQADALDVQAAALTMRTDRMASPQRLVERAAALGMVDNPSLVFLRLSDGRVLGDPVPAASTNTVPGLIAPPPTVTEPARRAADPRPAGAEPGSAVPDDVSTTAGASASARDAPTGSQKPRTRAGDEQDGTPASGRADSREGAQEDSQGDQ